MLKKLGKVPGASNCSNFTLICKHTCTKVYTRCHIVLKFPLIYMQTNIHYSIPHHSVRAHTHTMQNTNRNPKKHSSNWFDYPPRCSLLLLLREVPPPWLSLFLRDMGMSGSSHAGPRPSFMVWILLYSSKLTYPSTAT